MFQNIKGSTVTAHKQIEFEYPVGWLPLGFLSYLERSQVSYFHRQVSPATRWRWIKEAKTRTKITQKNILNLNMQLLNIKTY